MQGVINRICDGGEDLQTHALSASPHSDDMWMLLIVRMITRVVEPVADVPRNEDGSNTEEEQFIDISSRQDKLRQVLCDHIMADFPSR